MSTTAPLPPPAVDLDPVLDRAQTVDYDALSADVRYRIANHDVIFHADRDGNLRDLRWPWTDAVYARRVDLTVSTPYEEEIVPLAVRYFPGAQENIYGNIGDFGGGGEGIIISQRILAPYNSHYDRTVLWSLDCQAEGDHVIRIEVDIDWGEPLHQRMVDGLLLAQREPGPARGVYEQSNAESTRIFGNPNGRPDSLDLQDGEENSTAHLVYHVLVNGEIEVPLMLTVSDVGEQVAWSGFLALRDGEREHDRSVSRWEETLRRSRLWTPDVALNHSVQQSKATALRHVQRLRTGLAPSDRHVAHVPALVATLDLVDPTESRNLLAHLRRVTQRSEGRVPVEFPLRRRDEPSDPGPALPQTTAAYLLALRNHLRRHPSDELLADHAEAVSLCSEWLIRLRERLSPADAVVAGRGLRAAQDFALWRGDGVNTVRWENEACEMEKRGEAAEAESAPTPATLHTPEDAPWHFAEPWAGAALVGETLWSLLDLRWRKGELRLNPTWPSEGSNAWSWWALLDLPLANDVTSAPLSLFWDGDTLHTTQPVQLSRRLAGTPVQVHDAIRAVNSGEFNFDLQFELVDGDESTRVRVGF